MKRGFSFCIYGLDAKTFYFLGQPNFDRGVFVGFEKIASVDKLPAGSMMGIQVGGKDILISNVDNKFYAIGNVCTHASCRLSSGKLKRDRVTCPCHGSTFDVKSGTVVDGPAEKPELAYETKIRGNDILISV